MTQPITPNMKISVAPTYGMIIEERRYADGQVGSKVDRYIKILAPPQIEIEIGPYDDEAWERLKENVNDPQGAAARSAARMKLITP